MNDRHWPVGQAGGPVTLEKADGSNGPVIHRWWWCGKLLPRRARRVSPALWLHNAYPAIELKGETLRISENLCVGEGGLSRFLENIGDYQRFSEIIGVSQRCSWLCLSWIGSGLWTPSSTGTGATGNISGRA